MESNKVWAYRHSQEVDGKRLYKDKVEILESKTDNCTTYYIVQTSDGIVCTAIFNIFTGAYYADDVFGIIDDYSSRKNQDLVM